MSINPTEIETVRPGATYIVPVYGVTDSGLMEVGRKVLSFVKGAKDNPILNRQDGYMTETLLTACKQYLTDVNVGELQNEDTELAALHIQYAMDALKRRADKRIAAGTQVTMKP